MDKIIAALQLLDRNNRYMEDNEDQLQAIKKSMTKKETEIWDAVTMAYCMGEDAAHLKITGTLA